MKIHQFLEHHGLAENPFSQEDASSDHVFRKHLIDATRHPAWDKIYGSPDNPATAVVFGEQGAGKTALRMQITDATTKHNASHGDNRTFVVSYDDFNPFLDQLASRLPRRKQKSEAALGTVKLSDHMDAILSLAITRLMALLEDDHIDAANAVDRVDAKRRSKLSNPQRRDILLIAAAYDRSHERGPVVRWNSLRKRLGYHNWMTFMPLLFGVAYFIGAFSIGLAAVDDWRSMLNWWYPLILLAGFLPFAWFQLRAWLTARKVHRFVRVVDRPVSAVKSILLRIPRKDLVGQPLPTTEMTDPRYEMFDKLLAVLRTLGYSRMLVLVDRVDEPHLVNGSPERMRDLLWPMFDNKFLKMPDVAFKMLLPAAVKYYLDRQEAEFYQRSRLDKQNLVPALDWTGESLYDISNDRLRACVAEGKPSPEIDALFADDVTREQLVDTFTQLRVPRHLFKFYYRLLVDHCGKFTESDPQYRISRETLQSSFAIFRRDLDAYDRGAGTG